MNKEKLRRQFRMPISLEVTEMAMEFDNLDDLDNLDNLDDESSTESGI